MAHVLDRRDHLAGSDISEKGFDFLEASGSTEIVNHHCDVVDVAIIVLSVVRVLADLARLEERILLIFNFEVILHVLRRHVIVLRCVGFKRSDAGRVFFQV